jgi:hypothetical protein
MVAMEGRGQKSGRNFRTATPTPRASSRSTNGRAFCSGGSRNSKKVRVRFGPLFVVDPQAALGYWRQ